MRRRSSLRSRRPRHPQSPCCSASRWPGQSLIGIALVGMFAVFVDRYARLEEHQLQHNFGATSDEYRPGLPPF